MSPLIPAPPRSRPSGRTCRPVPTREARRPGRRASRVGTGRQVRPDGRLRGGAGMSGDIFDKLASERWDASGKRRYSPITGKLERLTAGDKLEIDRAAGEL